MDVTPESLKDKFQLLNDDELQHMFHSGELTELAQGVARAELRRRGISLEKPQVETPPEKTDDELDPELWSTSSGDLVLVGRFSSPIDAQVLQSRLAVDGIPAMVADALTAQNTPWGANLIGGVRVLVPESHVDRARKVINAIQAGDYALDDQADGGKQP